jgi:hypothetical protein
MFASIRAFWKQRKDKRLQEAIDRTTYEAAQRQAMSQNRQDSPKIDRAAAAGDP